MTKDEFLDVLANRTDNKIKSVMVVSDYQIEPKVLTADKKEHVIIPNPDGIETHEVIVLEKYCDGSARKKTIPFYVVYRGNTDPDKIEEAIPLNPIAEYISPFTVKVKTAIAAKKASGDFYTVKITDLDEDEKYADVEVTVATPGALQVEKKEYRLKENPVDANKIVCSQIVNEMKSKFFEGWRKLTDTVDVI